MKFLVLLLSLCSLPLLVAAQTAPPAHSCGAIQTPASRAKMDSLQKACDAHTAAFLSSPTYSVPDMVPVQAHIIRRSDGSGGLTQAEFDTAFAKLNNYYENANMEFFQCNPINFVDSDEYYNLSVSEETSFYNEHGVDDVINILIPGGNLTTSTGGLLCGYAYFPWSSGRDLIAVAADCMMSGNTFSHEIGHYYGLYHTHGKSNCGATTDELVNGSNCTTAGDDVCDTPADPGLLGLGCSGYVVNNNCQYTGNLTDANGDAYTPDVSNIMSYAPGFCRDDLSSGQYARVNYYHLNARDYLTCGSVPGNTDGEDCSSALQIPGSGTYTSDGPASGNGCHNCSGATHADWYFFDAVQDGNITIQSCNGGVDTRLWVYEGDCSNLIQVAFGEDECQVFPGGSPYASQVTMPVESGKRYYFEWDNRWSNSGFDFDFIVSQSCAPPSGVNTTSIGYSHATLTWSGVAGAQSYNIRYRSSNSSSWTLKSGINFEATTLYNLQPCSIYEWQIQTVCSGAPGNWSGSFVFSTQGCDEAYCYAYGESSQEWIDRVTIEDIDNISGNSQGYANYTNFSTNLQVGGTFSVFLRPETNSSPETVYWRIWIDLNRDNDFEDSGELVFQDSRDNQTIVSSNFSVPTNSSAGVTRLRIAMARGGYPQPCNTGGSQEVEDYTVNLTTPASLSVSPANINFPFSGGTEDVSVASNTDWTVIENAAWMNVAPKNGSNNGTFTVTANPNPSTNSRQAIIIVSATNATDQVVAVFQAGAPAALAVDPSDQNVSEAAGQASIQVVSNVDWTVSSNSSWAVPSPASGFGTGTVTVNYTANNSGLPRTATLTFDSPNADPVTATISQSSSGGGTLTISPATQTVDQEQGCVDYTVNSSESWTASSNASWISSLQPSSGDAGTSTITVCYDEHTGNLPRTADLLVFGTSLSAQATLSQLGSTLTPPWPVTVTGTNHTVVLPQGLYSEVNGMQLDELDWIGFFYEKGGSMACAGAGRWDPSGNSSIVVYGDDAQTPEKDGFFEGEFFQLRVYKSMSGEEFDAEGSYAPIGGIITHEDRFNINGLSQLDSIYSAASTPPWPITVTGTNHTMIIPQNLISDLDGQVLSPDDWIGFFYMDGDSLRCAGAGQWDPGASKAVAVYGDDEQTPEKDGFETGEAFAVKVWRSAEAAEYDVQAAYAPTGPLITHTDQFAINGISQLTEIILNSEVTIDIPLRTGWNMISSYVYPPSADMGDVFAPVNDDLVIVKDSDGNSYIPAFNINSIGEWDIRQGYQVKIDADRTLSITGEQAPEDLPIPLSNGWQIIAYLQDAPEDISLALADVSDNILVAKNNIGETYIPALGVNDIGDMEPTQGYQVRATASDTLAYDSAGAGFGGQPLVLEGRADLHLPYQDKTGSSGTLVLPAEVMAQYFPAGSWIAATSPDGEIYGMQFWGGRHAALTIWGDDKQTATEVEGLQDGQTYYLQAWDARKGLSANRYALQLEQGESPEFYDGQFAIVQELIPAQVAEEALQLLCHPNPVREELQVRFFRAAAAAGSLQLFSSTGQPVEAPRALAPAEGWTSERIDVSSLPAGSYWLQLSTPEQTITRAFIKL